MGQIPTETEIQHALEARQGAALQQKLKNASIAICGLGGLGSNIAVSLARAGIGHLHLIDFDRVDLSNLNRQQYAVSQLGSDKTEALCDVLNAIAPYCKVSTDNLRITEHNVRELLKQDDIICEAFDRAEEKAMLVNCVLEFYPEKYLIAASGMAGISSANDVKTRKIMKHFYLCGDEVSDVADRGMFSSRVMLCAAHQAHMVIRILAGEYEA